MHKEGERKKVMDCDGTQYKDSDVAYLHDIHTEKMMQSLGFDYQRIWSFDWWRKNLQKCKIYN